MRRTVLFVQARLNSERLHRKMLRTIYEDKSIIYLCLQAANDFPHYDDKALLVPYGEAQYFKDVADKFDFPIIEGPEKDVLGRFIIGLNEFPNAELVIKVCADKIIFAKSQQHWLSVIADEVFCDLTHFIYHPFKYFTSEIYKVSSLYCANFFYPYEKTDREHVKPLFTKHPHSWNIITVDVKPDEKLKYFNTDYSIDTEEDIERMKEVFSNFYAGKPLDFWDLISPLAKKENEI